MRAIILDFGNVVGFFDHRLTLARLTPYTDMPGDEMFRDIYQGELEDAFESGRISAADFLRSFRERCRLRCDDEYLAGAIADIFTPNPEVCELVPLLRQRYRLLLGSNTNPIHARHFRLQFAEVLAHFDGEVLSCEIGHRKPRPGFFQECVRRAGCDAAQCLFIDDIEENVQGARAVGLQGLLYTPDNTLPANLRSLGLEFS